MNVIILKAADWVWHTSLSAVVIVVCIAVAQLICGKILPARARLALWWLVVIRLLLPAAPASPFGAANLSVAMGAPYDRAVLTVSEAAPILGDPSPQPSQSFVSSPSPGAGRLLSWGVIVAALW